MENSQLVQDLKEHHIDLELRPKSFYAGGIEDVCRIEPDEIIAFFSASGKIRPTKWAHHRFQLKLNLGKPAFIGINELEFRLPTDYGIMVFPFQIHHIDTSAPLQSRFFFTITFSDRGNGISSVQALMNQPFRIDPEDRPLLRNIIGAYQKQPGFPAEEAIAGLKIFISRKLRQVRNGGMLPQIRNPLIEKLAVLFRENHTKQVSIKILAEQLNMSESNLRLKAKELLNGMSLGRFLQHLRFQRAYELLVHTDFSIHEVAVKCGYADTFSFSRAFKNDIGFSPTSFRQKYGRDILLNNDEK